MAKITGQTGLVLASSLANVGVDGNVWLDYTTFKISVRKYGSLDDGGVTIQALYSFIMKQWKDNNFEMFTFPMESITPGEFELRNGWDFADTTTKYLLRDGGWNLLSSDNSTLYEVWANIQSLGVVNDPENDQMYYIHSADGTPTPFELPGPINQAVQFYGCPEATHAGHGDFDYRLTSNSEFIVFLREQGKTYVKYNLNIAQVKSEIKNQVYALPIENRIDLDISTADGDIETLAPYTGMSITWGPIVRDLGSGNRNFSILIDANGGTLKQIYEFVQWSLRQSTDIDAGLSGQIGSLADEMLTFVGPVLKTKLTSSGGVFIENFQVADTNSIVFVDDTGQEQSYPYVAAGKIFFNDNLRADGANAKYWMYFLNANGNQYNTPNAIIVNDNSGDPITGVINGVEYVDFDYDYEGNVQGGRTPNTDAQIILIAIGSNYAKFVSALGTLTKSTLMSFTLTAAQERNYVA